MVRVAVTFWYEIASIFDRARGLRGARDVADPAEGPRAAWLPPNSVRPALNSGVEASMSIATYWSYTRHTWDDRNARTKL